MCLMPTTCTGTDGGDPLQTGALSPAVASLVTAIDTGKHQRPTGNGIAIRRLQSCARERVLNLEYQQSPQYAGAEARFLNVTEHASLRRSLVC